MRKTQRGVWHHSSASWRVVISASTEPSRPRWQRPARSGGRGLVAATTRSFGKRPACDAGAGREGGLPCHLAALGHRVPLHLGEAPVSAEGGRDARSSALVDHNDTLVRFIPVPPDRSAAAAGMSRRSPTRRDVRQDVAPFTRPRSSKCEADEDLFEELDLRLGQGGRVDRALPEPSVLLGVVVPGVLAAVPSERPVLGLAEPPPPADRLWRGTEQDGHVLDRQLVSEHRS